MKTFYKTCKELILISLCLLFQVNFLSAQVQTARPNTVINAHCHGFYEYLPQGYGSGTATYPVIIFLHGSGEVGDGSAGSLPLVLRNGPPKLINLGQFPVSFTVNGQSFKFIVISPQFNTWPTQQDVLDVVNYTLSHYRVDKTRVYLTGLSMGGGADWDFSSSTSTPTNTQMLAAIVPISGASSPSMQKATQMVKYKLPVWAFHNQSDPTVSVQNTIGYVNDMITAIATAVTQKVAVGPAPKMTIFPVSGHDAWTKAYDINYRENNLNVYEWMLSYTRGGSTSNAPPVVNAGADKSITLPTSSVALAGSATDADGTISKYAWTKISGPTQFTFSNTAISNPTVSNLAAGTYTFRLTATDNLGASAADDINIIVNAASNKAPVVNAGADKSITLPTNSVALAGSATDADGTIMKYAWTKISGPTQFTFSNTAISNPTVSNLAAGTYTFRLTATDNLGTSAADDINIIVNAASNNAPVVNAGADKSITLPTNSVALAGSATDADGTIMKYAWTKISGPTQFTFSNTAISNPTVSNLAAGTYTFRLTATDNLGTSAADDINVIVNNSSSPVGGTTGSIIKVNIYSGANPYNDAEWNNWTVSAGSATNISSGTFKYSDGSASTVTANLSQSTAITDNQLGYPVSGETMAPKEVLRYTSYSSANRTLTFSGLSASLHYSLEVYSSRNANEGNSTIVKSGSQTATIVTYKNFTNKAAFTGLVPDAQGKLIVSLSQTSAYNYINGFMLTADGSSSSISLPPVITGTKYLNVNVFSGSNPINDTQWFNWNIGSGSATNLVSPVLKYSDGTASTITANLSQSTAVTDNQLGYPVSGSVMAPKEVLRYTSYATAKRTLTLSGLSASRKYDIELYGSRNGNPGNTTIFSVSGLNTTITTYKNFTSAANFTGLTPDGQGKITVTLTSGSSYNYLNGFSITDGSTATSPSANASLLSSGTMEATAEDQVLNKEDGNISNSLKISPNPVHDSFILDLVNSELGSMQVQVIGVNGAVQKTFMMIKNQTHFTQSVSIGNLSAGTYFIRVQLKGWSGVSKILKL